MGGLFDALAANRELEDPVPGYGQFARDARGKLDAATKALWLAEARVAFLEGPARSWREARDRLGNARDEKDRRRRRELYADARTLFQACAKEGRAAISKIGALRAAPLVVDETQTTPDTVVDRCVLQDRAIAKTFARLRVVARTPAPGKAKNKRP